MRNIKLLCVAVLMAATGLAQASWHLPPSFVLTNTCEVFYSVQYTPPPAGQDWGWYSAKLDTTSCWYPGTSLASGPEVRKQLGFNDKGAVLVVNYPLIGGLAVFVVNRDKTYTIKDMAGNTFRSGTWF